VDKCKPLGRAGGVGADAATRKRLKFSQGALRPNPAAPPVGALFCCEKALSDDGYLYPAARKVDEVGGMVRYRPGSDTSACMRKHQAFRALAPVPKKALYVGLS
jgi:hypothetical protein